MATKWPKNRKSTKHDLDAAAVELQAATDEATAADAYARAEAWARSTDGSPYGSRVVNSRSQE